MVMQFLDALADLEDALETLLLVQFVVFADVECVPGLRNTYQSDPPEQYSVMYQTVSG
jgi:hypothetical protein